MKYMKGTLGLLVAILILGMGINACGSGGPVSWKEEVLLHDGGKIIVTRSQSHGGRHELGQPPPIKEHSITFTLPGSNKAITWKDEYSEDVGAANFILLGLHILNNTPYLVASPDGCISYNKWGRPNPPYVVFKYDGKAWQRIPLSEFPDEFKNINLALGNLGDEKKLASQGLVSASMIKQLNSVAKQPEYKTILREPVQPGAEGSSVNCIELVLYKGSWIMPNDPVMHRLLDQKKK